MTRRTLLVVLGAGVLVLLLGGGVTAASLITGRQIKDGTVSGRDLRNGSLTGADVRDGSLSPADYGGTVVGGPGNAGPAGPAGPSGPPGPPGVPGIQDIEYRTSPPLSVSSGRYTYESASCPVGSTALSGGFATRVAPVGTRLMVSVPLANGTGWRVGVQNDGASALTGYVWVTCARAQ